MKVVQRVSVLLLSCLYLWVSGTIVWHTHSQPHDCTEDSTDHHQHLPDEDSCSVCFFIHSGSAALSTPFIKLSIFEKPFGIAINDQITIQYKSLVIRLSSNKDPPVSA